MDLPDIKLIRIMRKQLEWTQKDLADETGITQSMINKIEKGSKLPSFETAIKIFQVLNDRLKNQTGKPGIAKDISVKFIKSVHQDDTVADAIKKLGNEIDQLPVMDEDKCIGSFSNRRIMSLLNDPDFKNKKIRDVMEPPFPIISEEESLGKVRKLLEIFDAVLTTQEGKINGIITRSDLLKML
jgi:predicted transcriptional regulator